MANVTSDSSIEELVLIPGGEFLMGSDSERFGDHSPIRKAIQYVISTANRPLG